MKKKDFFVLKDADDEDFSPEFLKSVDDDDDDELPPELRKYMPLMEAIEDGDYGEIVSCALKLFFVPLLIALVVIIVAFMIKWWLGFLAFFGVLIFFVYKGYGIYRKLEDD